VQRCAKRRRDPLRCRSSSAATVDHGGIRTGAATPAACRWWEARKILGGMLGLTRDLVRQVSMTQALLRSTTVHCDRHLQCASRRCTQTQRGCEMQQKTPKSTARRSAAHWLPQMWKRVGCLSTSSSSDVSPCCLLQAMTVAKPGSGHLVAMLARWTVAMPHILHHHVTEFSGLPPQLQVGTRVLDTYLHMRAPAAESSCHLHCQHQLQARCASTAHSASCASWHGLWCADSLHASSHGAACVRLQRVLTKQELEYLEHAQHRPTAVSQVPEPAADGGNNTSAHQQALCTCTLTFLTGHAKLQHSGKVRCQIRQLRCLRCRPHRTLRMHWPART
jgi:hypothetical protein